MKRGITNCTYAITANDDSLQLLRLFRSISEDHAAYLLASFRHGMDVASLLAIFSIADGRTLLATGPGAELDPQQTRLLQPPKNALELESIAKNTHAYPTLSVINARDLAQSHLLRPVQSLYSKRRGSVCDHPCLAAITVP